MISSYEQKLREYFETRQKKIYQEIIEEKKLSEALEKKIKTAVEGFTDSFLLKIETNV